MSFPLEYFKYQSGLLSCDGVSLASVVEKVGTPTYVYSADALLSALAAFQRGLDGLHPMICFAVKSNSNVSILELLSKAGAGMDVVSGGELYRAGIAGVSGERIVFSGVGKTTQEMAAALHYGENGIFSFNVESVEELAALNQVALQFGRKARIAFRFNPDVNAKTHPYISTGLKKNKFGLNRLEILKLSKKMKDYPGIDLKGISIHIGSQLTSLAPLAEAFALARSLITELQPLLKSPLEYVDLGGGLGITYKKENPPSIEDYCKLIRKHLGKSGLKILIEPGRIISGNAGVLLTKVLFRKQRGPKDFLIVDAAMNDLMRPSLYGSYHEIVPVRKELQKRALRKTQIVGPVCESADCFGDNRKLSSELEKGDLLAILSAGAYGFSMASNYNTRGRPAEVLIEKGACRIIRRRESDRQQIENELV